MKEVLTRIQTGEYAKDFILENRAGAPTLLSRRRMTSRAFDRGRRREAALDDAVDQEEQARRPDAQLTGCIDRPELATVRRRRVRAQAASLARRDSADWAGLDRDAAGRSSSSLPRQGRWLGSSDLGARHRRAARRAERRPGRPRTRKRASRAPARPRPSRGRASTPRNALERARGRRRHARCTRRRAAAVTIAIGSAQDMNAPRTPRRAPHVDSNYPHPIIAREGWPFIADRAGRRRRAVARVGWWLLAALAWLVFVFVAAVLPRSAAHRPRAAERRAVARRRPRRRGRQGARSVPRPRRAEDQRVHERVQRAFQPQPGRRRRRAALVSRRQLRQRRARQGVARERAQRAAPRARRRAPTSPACRSPGSIARRILCYVEARRPARARPALRLHPLRLARGRLPAARRAPARRRRRQGPRDRRRSLAELSRAGDARTLSIARYRSPAMDDYDTSARC